jgi:hypothetical protein
MDVAEAMGHLARLRTQFAASLTPQQRAWQLEIEDADTDHRIWASDMLLEELIRHLTPPYPVLRLLYSHLVGQCFPDVGKCCRSPEEEDAEYDGEARP